MLTNNRIIINFFRLPLYNNFNNVINKRLYVYNFNRFKSNTKYSEDKPKVVVLGTGWSSMFFIKNLNPKQFDLTVISPRNYFTFTPLLPKILSGMANSNTASEPIIDFMRKYFKNNSNFIHASCIDVDINTNSITCISIDEDNNTFSLSYDYLIIGVGATSNTFGIKGVDKYAYFLKEVEHAEIVYQKILNNFRIASMPFITDDEKKRLLHFIVVGGGPTGVESTGELSELINKYMNKTYPELKKYVKVSIIEGGNRLLPSMAYTSSKYVENLFKKSNINIYFNKVVCEVKENSCILKENSTNNIEEIQCGLVIWASGLKEIELVTKLKKKWNLPENSRSLLVNEYLKVNGTDNVFCLGDCCKLNPNKLQDNVDLIINTIGQPNLDKLINNRKKLSNKFPQLNDYKWKYKDEKFINAVSEIITKYGKNNKESFIEILKYIDKTYIPPFPTAQNAKQEAIYLSKLFNNGTIISKNYQNNAFCEEWNGTLASLGGMKVLINTPLFNINGGPIPFLMWNVVYLAMFSSCRMRASFLFDLLLSLFKSRSLVYKRYKNT